MRFKACMPWHWHASHASQPQACPDSDSSVLLRQASNDVQCNIWTFCNPETGEGCDDTCEPSQYNYNPSNPSDPLRFGQSSGCLAGNQWPK